MLGAHVEIELPMSIFQEMHCIFGGIAGLASKKVITKVLGHEYTDYNPQALQLGNVVLESMPTRPRSKRLNVYVVKME